MLKRIKSYGLEAHNCPSDLVICPHCGIKPECFKLHELRERLFKAIDGKDKDRKVCEVESCLGRWKCSGPSGCGHTFTYYPDFAVPYKNYIRDNIMDLCTKYVTDADATYEKVVLEIGYSANQPVGSTLWKWLKTLGSLFNVVQNAMKLILQKDPATNISRQCQPIHKRKYRSDRRKEQLNNYVRLTIVGKEYMSMYNTSIFPRLGNAWC